MAGPRVAGPAHLWIGLGSTYSPLYLGTCERTPRVSFRPQYSQVFNDVAGGKIPWDVGFQGKDAIVVADVTRFNPAVELTMLQLPRPASIGGNALSTFLTESPGDIGSLMITEGCAYPLWLELPYGAGGRNAHPAYADMIPGIHFGSVYLLGPVDWDNLNTDARKNRYVWHCLRNYATNQQGTGFSLGDVNMAAVLGLTPN